jgi:hypothetical protein
VSKHIDTVYVVPKAHRDKRLTSIFMELLSLEGTTILHFRYIVPVGQSVEMILDLPFMMLEETLSTRFLLREKQVDCSIYLTWLLRTQLKNSGSIPPLYTRSDDSACTTQAPPQQMNPPQPNAWLASSHPNWNNLPPPPGWAPPQNPPGPARPPPGSPAASAIFDGKDRLALKDDWYLIRGGDSFFLEHGTAALDLPASQISDNPAGDDCSNGRYGDYDEDT